jgi:putative membrane-bound dehydrogenase-like protein
VVEGHTYPIPAAEGKGKDRILIFEDSDGNGSLDKRKVFMENLNLVSGIEVGMGGVWLCAAPYLLFIPTDFERDVPIGDIQKILDGWGTQDTHEVLNNLRWGPDGWLYGVHGVFTHSKVGKPGTPENERIKINAGVWRLHPSTHQFEVFSEGTSNPWGIDFNDYGHAFITVCVIPHMYHVIQGARYERQAGKSFNPYTYDEIKTIADHKHYVGERGPHAGNFRSALAGGGHAHAGAMIYLGGSSWPAEYRNVIFMNNINGARLNNDLLTRKGSGYVASHKNDFLAMNDSWSQWLNMKYDPSGSVFAIDWYDKNQCHSTNPDVHDKTMGRIFKISYKSDSSIKVNLYKASDMALVNYQLHDNEWFVRNARTILQERGANEAVHNALIQIINNHPDITRKLRALWTLHVTKGANESILQNLLSHENENIRSWAIQLLLEKKEVSPSILVELENMAKKETSPLVRLYLTAGLMRMPLEQRWKILDILVKKEEDMKDHNLPLMLWYAAEPLAEISMEKLIGLAESAKMPHFLKYTIQRIGAKNTDDAKKLLRELASRLGHKHENHENVLLIEKLISPKS